MSLQNHNFVWLEQRLKELKDENPERISEIIAFGAYAKILADEYSKCGIDLWISEVSLQDGEIAYTIGVQAQTENPKTLELLERLANV